MNAKKGFEKNASASEAEGIEPPALCTLNEGFDNVSNLTATGWFTQNNSMPLGGTGWFQGNPTMFPSQSGASNSYIAADFNNGAAAATISNWLLTPTLTLENGGLLTFWTRTPTSAAQLFPDRLQVRMSTNGSSTDVGTTATSVGDFTTLLLDINPAYADNYPHDWTQYSVTLSGLASPTNGRLAFRYFVENGGPSGTRSNYIGIDTMAYICPPTPSPSPTPTPTPPSPPTLGNYPATSMLLSADMTISPDAPATSTANINVSTSTNFKGRLEGNRTTGVVHVTNAHPAGTYTVTIKAFNTLGDSVTKTFTLRVTTPPTCTPVSFALSTSSTAVSDPRSVAIGDFNGDGLQDLAVANFASSTVSIFLGDGAGSFSTVTSFTVGSGPISMDVGDFNGDGNEDLAVANFNSNNLTILMGNGLGGFPTSTNFLLDTPPRSIAVGDFNRDGWPDLAVVDNSVVVLINDGFGSFTKSSYSVGSGPTKLVVGDFNKDSKQDIAITKGTGAVSILLGDGAGSFQPPADFFAVSNADSIALGDFNNDGSQDLAVASANPVVAIYLGDGTGLFHFVNSVTVGSAPKSLAVGDFDGDGKQDLITANNAGNVNNISMMLGDGTGHFSSMTSFPAGFTPYAVAVCDLNGDGKQDIAITNTQTSRVSILLRDCALTPTSAVSRKIHGSAGTFDVNLPLTGSPAIECRTTGRTTDDYTIIITFANAVTVDGTPQAAVTLGTGCVGTGGACSGSVTIGGNAVTIPLTNVTNAQTINVTLFRVNNGSNLVIPMGVLGGDVNGNRAVNASDVALAKGRIGQAVDATNFRADINANGVINATDVSVVKSNVGSGVSVSAKKN